MNRMIAALLTVLTAAWAMGAVPALAQSAGGGRAGGLSVDVVVESFPGVLDPDDREIRLQLRLSNPTRRALQEVAVVAGVHRRTRSRFDFQQAMDAGGVGARLAAVVEGVGALPAGASEVLRLQRPRGELGLPEGGPAGVYPLQIRVLVGSEEAAEVTTSIVVTGDDPGAPLRAAFLLPVDAPPLVPPPADHSTAAAAAPAPLRHAPERVMTALGPDSRLRDLLDAAGAPEAFPVTVASSARLLDEAADVAGRADDEATTAATAADRFLTTLRTLVGRTDIAHITLPYGPPDLVAMVRGGAELEAVRHLSIAAEIARDHLGDAPLAGFVWPPDGLDHATLRRAVVPSGGDALILGEEDLAIPDGRELPVSPSPVRALRVTPGRDLTALVPDPWLSAVLAAPADLGVAVGAQRVVAETAALYYERPFSEDVRGLLLAPPQLWDPPEGFAEGLLSALGEAPWLLPVGIDRLAAVVDPEPRPVSLGYGPANRARELPQPLIDSLQRARSALGALATLLPAGDPTPARLDRRLLTAPAIHNRRPARREEAAALVRSVQDFADTLFGTVTVNDGLQLILPGTQGTIPVSITNSSAVPLRVTVRLGASARRNLDFADGAIEPVVLAPSATTTLPFDAEVRTPGATFPIEVLVTDVGGTRVLAGGRLVVRSTAASPVALLLTGGAMIFLLAWWLRDARRKQVRRRPSPPAPLRQPVHR